MHLGWLFVLLGLLFAGLGVGILEQGGSWLALWALWPALSFWIVSAAYLGVGPKLLGKRADGSLPAWRVIALLPYFVFTWTVWRLLRLSAEPTYDRVAPGLYLGRLPLRGEVPDDVGLVVDLTAEFPRTKAAPPGADYLLLPTLDAFVPDLAACEVLVRAVAAHPGPAYVHCAQGHGRSALIAAAVLLQRGTVSTVDDAIAMLKRARPRINLSSSQRAMLRALHARMASAPPGS